MNANALATTHSTELQIFETQSFESNPAAVFLASVKPNSQRIYRSDLNAIARLLGVPQLLNSEGDDITCLACKWEALRFQHTAAVRARLSENISEATGKPLAPKTVNRLLCALRGVLKAAWQLEKMTAEEYHRARDIKSMTGETLPAGRELASGELAALMAACENDTSSAGVRDAALIALMYSGGLRRAEVVGLDLDDFEQESGLLKVFGKRSKERTCYLVNGAARAMADWLAIRSDKPGPLFWPINKGGVLQARRMTTQAIYNMLVKRGAEAGVKNFSPHDLRRTFVSDLLDLGADISTVAKMAGHASVTTTARYDRRPEQAKQKAAGLLHVPYRGRLVR